MDGFIGEIRPFAFGFVPQGWLPCNGSSLPIAQYSVLYAIIGTIYGGNGTSTFNLPNLNGSTPVGSGNSPSTGNWPLGGQSGTESVTLTTNEIPAHNHAVNMEVVSSPTNIQSNTLSTPVSNSSWLTHPLTIPAPDHAVPIPNFTPSTAGNPDTILNQSSVGAAGEGLPHENRQPYLAIQYCICNEGVFPPHS
ncbi:MAG: phage tail protein [Burkholderiales bacterium]|nr:phage tail protein [Burkholderiales bacterium]